MKHKNYDTQIIKLTGGLDKEKEDKIEAFFDLFEEKTELSMFGKNQLIEHFISCFEYYLDKGKDVDEILELLDPSELLYFYNDKRREYMPLDNAAIVYPLGMKNDQMPMFRLSVELKKDIEPCILQMALDFTIRRFPGFLSAIRNGFFWHYLEISKYIPLIEEENDIPCKPISLVLRSERSFRVLYYPD